MSEFNSSEGRLAELKKLGELKESGLLSEEEFEAEKKRILIATTETMNNESADSDRYQAGSHKTKSQLEWDKFDKSSLIPLLKRSGKFYLGGMVVVVPLFLLFPAQIISLMVFLWLLEIVFAIVSKFIGKRIGLTPVLRSWLMRKQKS